MKNTPPVETLNFKRIVLKVVLILLLVNFGWALLPDRWIGQMSIYNVITTGRERLPFGENPDRSYNLSLYNLDAMFSSHKINAKRKSENLRVFLVGDSSIWGFLQKPDQSLSGILNSKLNNIDIEIFNLGYPSISILKDLQVIDYAMRYQPDLVLWFTTLEALPIQKQLTTPINLNNPENINRLIENYQLQGISKQEARIFDRTFWAERRNLFDILRLQLYGFLWSATGVDQDYPDFYNPAQRDFPNMEATFYGLSPDDALEEILAFEVIANTIFNNPETDFILINEPILVSAGENANIRYNFYYPRWAYDDYREIMNDFASENDIKYYDLWNLIPQEEFTNSAIHLTIRGEQMLAERVSEIIIDRIGE